MAGSPDETKAGTTLHGKYALVTGATGGLGYAIAERLAAEGCNVIVNGIVPPEEMTEPIARLAKHGVAARYLRADLRDPDEISDMMNAAAGACGAVDILVNNAVVRHFSPVEQFPVERWNEALAVNLSAAFHTIRLALPAMRTRGFGRIINMGSPYSFFAATSRIDYVTTKTAILGLTRAIALETAGTDITCNAICPGTLPTPAIEARIATMAAERTITVDEATRLYLADRQPGGRFIPLETVAALVAFLCGPASREISGAALPVDSAWTAS
jgi:3-hydroxybutyrate dehydrogenase